MKMQMKEGSSRQHTDSFICVRAVIRKYQPGHQGTTQRTGPSTTDLPTPPPPHGDSAGYNRLKRSKTSPGGGGGGGGTCFNFHSDGGGAPPWTPSPPPLDPLPPPPAQASPWGGGGFRKRSVSMPSRCRSTVWSSSGNKFGKYCFEPLLDA